MEEKESTTAIKLPICPKILNGRIIRNIPISEIKPGKIEGKSIEISQAVVAYLDVLGFSDKINDSDIEACILDFAGVLIVASNLYPKVHFNVFSDCAFMSAPKGNAEDLLSALRFAFGQWINDGVLVRGGLAIGSYRTHP
jgi:hypothetical protein